MIAFNQSLANQAPTLKPSAAPSLPSSTGPKTHAIQGGDLAAIACTGVSATLALVLQEGLAAIPGFALAMGLNIVNRRQDANQIFEQILQRRSALEQVWSATQALDAQTSEIRQVLDQAIANPQPIMATQTLKGRGRVCILIDEANLSIPILQQDKRLDYCKLLERLCQGAAAVDKALIFTGYTPGFVRQERFHHRLEEMGYHLLKKETIHRNDGSSKANFDVEITLQMLQRLPHYDTLVLVSGDGDFAAALKKIQGFGRRVEVVSWADQTSHRLKEVADKFTALDTITAEITR